MIDKDKKDIETLIRETDDVNFRIKDLRRKNKELTAENDKNIDLLQTELTGIEHQIEEALKESRENSIKVKCGWTHWKIPKDKVVFTDKTIEEIETKYPAKADRYIKTEKSLKLKPLKRDIESGEIALKEMTIEAQERKFEYKYTGD